MITPSYLLICAYCLLQLLFLVVLESRRRNGHLGQERHFRQMLAIAIAAFGADILSALPTTPRWLYILSASGNYLEMILSTCLIPIFFLFCCEQIPDLKTNVRRTLSWTLVSMATLCSLTIASTAISGQVFYFDDRLVYHRGPLFFVPMGMQLVMMATVGIFLIAQRKKLIPQEYYSLLLFFVAPLLGWALQSVYFGLPFALCGITFSAQVVYSNIQSRNIDKDYLTGAFNRQALDRYVTNRMCRSEKQPGFAIILLDVDNFKTINDRYGHYEGDIALIRTVSVLRKAVRREDFIARYGGDEFCIVMDGDEVEGIKGTIRSIHEQFQAAGDQSDIPYPLDSSIGYAVYRKTMGEDLAQLYREMDRSMYENKTRRKEFFEAD